MNDIVKDFLEWSIGQIEYEDYDTKEEIELKSAIVYICEKLDITLDKAVFK